MYDYLIVGSGLFGSVFAYQATQKGYKCLVIERRSHIGGNIYCEIKDGIPIHTYGAHIFHTNNEKVWEFVNQFVSFNNFVNSPIANYKGELYNLPFNMNTFTKIWPDVKTPEDAKNRIKEQSQKITTKPTNLEEQAISLVGEDIYFKLIKEYTEKQWNKPCNELPPSIIKRLPVRFTFDNNYFNSKYQGIPNESYNTLIEKLLANCEVRTNTDFLKDRDYFSKIAKKIVYTGPIDEFYNYELGELSYRSLRFETERLETDNYQGNAVMNFTSHEVPYTRVIEHKHFAFINSDCTYVTKEYPQNWKHGDEAYYPLNNEVNMELYKKYRKKADLDPNIIFGGRLGSYAYFDMDQVVQSALNVAERELNK